MKITDFLSDHSYIILPTKANPKVYLPIADINTVNKAFELYNPFSKKAKFLKEVALFLCLNLKPLARIVFPVVNGKKSKLVAFLETQLSSNITSAVYIATAKDKIVLQLQDKEKLIGYLKFPISDLGKTRLQNEINAIEILSKKNIIPPVLLKNRYENTPFILLKPITGKIGSVQKIDYNKVLKSFQREEYFLLASHPRVDQINNQLHHLKLTHLIEDFEQILRDSKEKYELVYEHGDFASWNLVSTQNGIIPFDFEYFEENGLAYFDEIKFHFQEHHLLHKKKGKTLLDAISAAVDIKEFDCIFHLFLLKEIINKTLSKESTTFENSLLKLVTSP